MGITKSEQLIIDKLNVSLNECSKLKKQVENLEKALHKERVFRTWVDAHNIHLELHDKGDLESMAKAVDFADKKVNDKDFQAKVLAKIKLDKGGE